VAAVRLFVLLSFTLAALPAMAQLPADEPTAACLTDGRVEDLLLAHGVVYLAGRFEKVRPPGTGAGDPAERSRRWFAACDATTGAVLDWDPQATCDAEVYASCANGPRGQTLALAADGESIYLGGKFRAVGGTARRHAARVSRTDATLDPNWAPEPNDRVQRIVTAPDGERVYLAGTFTQAGGCAPPPCHERLAAVAPTSGAIDPGFAPEVACTVVPPASSCFATVHALALSADGERLYLGGQFDRVGGEARASAAALDAETGALVESFAPALADPNPEDSFVQVYDVRLDDDWVYLCGDWWATEGIGAKSDQRNVNRFDHDTGAVDPDFWIATDGGVQACAIDPNLGVLFVGGHFDCVREWVDSTTPTDADAQPCGGDEGFLGTPQRDLFALTLAEGALLAWNPDTSGVPGVWAMTRAEGRLAAGGEVAWPRLTPASHANLLLFALPLFTDGFESNDTARWSTTVPLLLLSGTGERR
jgi:hypothetical protein